MSACVICFLKDIFVMIQNWYIYTQLYHHIIGYNKWIRIVLLLFCLFVSFSHALTSSSFFWISLQKRVLLRRGGKGTINPWWPPHKKTKQTLPPPTLLSSSVSFEAAIESHVYQDIESFHCAPNYQVINLNVFLL